MCTALTPVRSERDLLLIIIIVGAGQQMPKDQLRDIYFLLFVNLDGNPISIVPNTDAIVLLKHSAINEWPTAAQMNSCFSSSVSHHRNVDLQGVHFGISDLVVCCID